MISPLSACVVLCTYCYISFVRGLLCCSQWLTALIETGEKHIAAKAGAGTWKHVTPPDNLWLEGSYEGMPIAELHAKVDEAMGNLAEAYRQRDGAKRHKQVMIQIATPKHTPKRRQKKLRKAAEERIAAATVEGDATIAKMHENILSWKGEWDPLASSLDNEADCLHVYLSPAAVLLWRMAAHPRGSRRRRHPVRAGEDGSTAGRDDEGRRDRAREFAGESEGDSPDNHGFRR